MTGESRSSAASVSVHTGPDARVSCAVYPDSAPILVLNTSAAGLTITAAGFPEISAADVEFASELARVTARYAAECQRVRAQCEAPALAPMLPHQGGDDTTRADAGPA